MKEDRMGGRQKGETVSYYEAVKYSHAKERDMTVHRKVQKEKRRKEKVAYRAP